MIKVYCALPTEKLGPQNIRWGFIWFFKRQALQNMRELLARGGATGSVGSSLPSYFLPQNRTMQMKCLVFLTISLIRRVALFCFACVFRGEPTRARSILPNWLVFTWSTSYTYRTQLVSGSLYYFIGEADPCPKPALLAQPTHCSRAGQLRSPHLWQIIFSRWIEIGPNTQIDPSQASLSHIIKLQRSWF